MPSAHPHATVARPMGDKATHARRATRLTLRPVPLSAEDRKFLHEHAPDPLFNEVVSA